MVGERGEEKNGVGRIFCKVILIDALLGGCIEEWIGIGLRVGRGGKEGGGWKMCFGCDWRGVIGEW